MCSSSFLVAAVASAVAKGSEGDGFRKDHKGGG